VSSDTEVEFARYVDPDEGFVVVVSEDANDSYPYKVDVLTSEYEDHAEFLHASQAFVFAGVVTSAAREGRRVVDGNDLQRAMTVFLSEVVL